MTNTKTGGTFAIFLIFSSLTDVSFPRKYSKFFLSTRERTDSSLAICDKVTSAHPPALERSLDSTSACMALIRKSLVYCFFERTVLTACRYTVVAPATMFVLRDEAERLHLSQNLQRESTILMNDSFVGKDLCSSFATPRHQRLCFTLVEIERQTKFPGRVNIDSCGFAYFVNEL